MSDDPLAEAGYLDVPPSAGGAAGRSWWDANAEEYLDEHGTFLGPADFCWCPEGLREQDVRLLGDLSGRRVLEVGAGAAQCAPKSFYIEGGRIVLCPEVCASVQGDNAAQLQVLFDCLIPID